MRIRTPQKFGPPPILLPKLELLLCFCAFVLLRFCALSLLSLFVLTFLYRFLNQFCLSDPRLPG